VVSSGSGQLVADCCGHGDEQSGVHKVRAVSWPVEELFCREGTVVPRHFAEDWHRHVSVSVRAGGY